MSPSIHNSLAGASLAALQWDYLGGAARVLCSMAVTVVLARLLGPEPFGLVAIAWLIIGMGNLIADLGIGPALVQKAAILDHEIRWAFTFQVGLGLCLAVMLALSSPLLGHVFDKPNLTPVVSALAPVFVLQAFGVTALSLLRRRLDFKRIQIAQVGSYLIGFLCLGIPLALFGFAVWSLVVAQLAQAALFSLFCYLQVRHPISLRFAWPESGLVDFGSKVLLSNLVNWSITNLPTLFIGRLFDARVLGMYNRAYMLVTTPMQSAVVTVQRVAFSTYSRRQNDPETIRKAYLASVGFMTLVMAPAYGSAALVPGTIIHGLFGAGWDAAIPLMVPLALAMPLHAVMALGGPLLWSQNRVGQEFRAQLLTAAVFCTVLFATARISLNIMVWGVFAISVLRFVLVIHASLRAVCASWSNLFKSMRGGLVLLVSTAPVVFLCDQVIGLWHDSAWGRLVLDLMIGLGVVITTIGMAPRQIFSPEMFWLWGLVAKHVPAATNLVMRRLVPL